MTRHPRGATLPEILAGLVLFGLAGTAGTSAWLHASRLYRAAQERARVGEAFDASLGYLSADLAELSPGDLIAATPQGLTFRAMRLDGHACLVGAGGVHVSLARLRADRLPQPGRDSLMVLVSSDSGPRWVRSSIRGVGTGSCGSTAALWLAGDSSALAGTGLGAAPLVPVRTFEVMEARFYLSGGARWLGARSVSAGEVIQPLAGPFENGAGLSVLDSAGLPTTVAATRQVGALLDARRADWLGTGSLARDSASATLHPRNLLP